MNAAARKDNANVRISPDVAKMLDETTIEDFGTSRTKKANYLIVKGMKSGNGDTFELDNTQRQQFFKHLTAGADKAYQSELKGLELTERELINMALEKSGKTYASLLKEALISAAKEAITLAARREHVDQSTDGSPEKRLQEAFAELTDMMMDGSYKPRGGRLNISAVAQRSRVNYNTARKWAEGNQPELLE